MYGTVDRRRAGPLLELFDFSFCAQSAVQSHTETPWRHIEVSRDSESELETAKSECVGLRSAGGLRGFSADSSTGRASAVSARAGRP